MNFASIGRPKMAWYDERKSATSNVLCTEVLLCAEGDWQAYTTYGVCSLAGHNPVEGFITGSHLAEVELHLAQRLCEDDV
jgi:hypothetical protein